MIGFYCIALDYSYLATDPDFFVHQHHGLANNFCYFVQLCFDLETDFDHILRRDLGIDPYYFAHLYYDLVTDLCYILPRYFDLVTDPCHTGRATGHDCSALLPHDRATGCDCSHR